MPSPWFITDADAKKRDALVTRDIVQDVLRIRRPGMSDEQLQRALARECGYSPALLKHIFHRVEIIR